MSSNSGDVSGGEEPEDSLEEFIYRLAPKGSITLFRLLKNEGREMTEDEIAEKLGMNKNTVRKVLYKLHDLNILVYRRMKEESTNWNTYYWKINWEGLSAALLSRKREVLEKLKLRLSHEKSNRVIYRCQKCGREYSFDEALANDFMCPICGVPLDYVDRSKEIALLEDYVRKLEEELADESKKVQGG